MGAVVVHVSGAVGGDARPALAAAWALHARGHDVTVLADPATASACAAVGLRSLALPDGSDWGTARRAAAPPPAPPGERPDLDAADAQHLRTLHAWSRSVAPVLADVARDRDATVLLAGLLGLPAAVMAAPLVGARVAAVNPTFVFGPDGARSVADEVDRPFRATYGDYLSPLLTNADVVAHATTAVFDPVRSLSANAGLVGPLRWDVGLPPAPGWVAEPGPPWALVVMPAIPLPGDDDIAVAAVATLSERPVRTLVVLRGRPAGVLGTLPPNTVVVPDLPREEVLTHAAICVGPASHGTVMAALRHGVPLVVVPWTADQPGVAWRVSRSGAGVSVVPDGDVAGSVKDAVERVLHDPRYAAGAAEVAAAIAASPEPMTAVADLVEALL